ncbi:TPA: NnrS family protein [Aeromonas salmonicida]|uniref:NnrS family protein n=1 Tax=Aeromonas salmonicida TaxID=645 RepID=UPI000B591143|nr:NnrS family protein [Aeromonas salmonicida]ASI21848.1 heme-Cu protein NnrS [Aeromonas salmonicida]ASI26165.1 heme-Cu protein NnrS [Aeromonas salmonicida]ASI30283.1 heme-Cu protein NnrS [Aeromonas salmonicida]QOI93225.1 NnrS family protein [Aeromonas salmonicida subsp. masoucida]QYH24522.1 NnrS family protein [Aeromonas salmonicida subsp. masoucida]
MLQILDSRKEEQIVPLFRLGFRPFFLLGALFSALAMLGWLAQLNGWILLPGVSNPIWWHAHEMLFGFGAAIVAGFLLTAVQNWTAHPGVRGWPLALVVGLWAVPRCLLPWLGEGNPVLMMMDLMWLPLCAWFLAKPIIVTRQWRNLFFVPLLVVLTLLNGASWLWHEEWIAIEHLLITTVLLFTTLIAVMGRRVIPFFTARDTGLEKAAPLPWLERAALASLWLILLCWLLLPTQWTTSTYMVPLYIVAAGLHLWRQLRWRLPTTLAHPLLWSLHLAYLFIPLGLLALGAQAAGLPITLSTASHLLSAGCMGTMILGMIARVSLGHSGRALQVGRRISCAFALVIAAAVIRVVIPLLWPAYTLPGWNLSGLAWVGAYGLFVWVYAPILTSPRTDGRPG